MRTRIILAAIGLVAAGLNIGSVAAVAQADPGQITCRNGTFNAKFSPALTFIPRMTKITATGNLGTCKSEKYPNITGGTATATGQLQASCPGPIGPGQAVVKVVWSDGSTSTANALFRGDAGTFDYNGVITEGLFKGNGTKARGKTTGLLTKLAPGCIGANLTEYTATIDESSLDPK